MQDRYAGDVGDFGKFGLLRHLCGITATKTTPSLKPGVIWYRVADETHNADGRHISYLERNPRNHQRFRACDDVVYDALEKLVFQDNDRSIAALERAALLPKAAYFRDDVCYGSPQITGPREDWFKGALEKTACCDLVFVDPDNGICGESVPETHRRSCKYVLLREIRLLIERKLQPKPTVVIYQHMDQTKGSAREKTEQQLETLRKDLPLLDLPFGILYHRGTTRAFLVLPTPEDRLTLIKRTEELIQKWNNAWGKGRPQHFTGPIMV